MAIATVIVTPIAALVAALLAAGSAARRQREALLAEQTRTTQMLDAEAKRLDKQLAAEASRLDEQLAQDRRLRGAEDFRLIVDDTLDRLDAGRDSSRKLVAGIREGDDEAVNTALTDLDTDRAALESAVNRIGFRAPEGSEVVGALLAVLECVRELVAAAGASRARTGDAQGRDDRFQQASSSYLMAFAQFMKAARDALQRF